MEGFEVDEVRDGLDVVDCGIVEVAPDRDVGVAGLVYFSGCGLEGLVLKR